MMPLQLLPWRCRHCNDLGLASSGFIDGKQRLIVSRHCHACGKHFLAKSKGR